MALGLSSCSRMQTNQAEPKAAEFVTAWTPSLLYKFNHTQVTPDNPSYIVFLNTRDGITDFFEVPFEAHTVVQNPVRQHLFLLVPKWGKSLAIFDRRENKISSLLKNDRRFFGHAVWDERGTGAYFSERDDQKNEGLIVYRNLSLQEKSHFFSGGDRPHDLQWDNQELLIVANAGSSSHKANLTWLNIHNGNILKSVDCSSNHRKRWISHFCQLPKTGKIIVTGMNDTETRESLFLKVDVPSLTTNKIELPEIYRNRFAGESLSITSNPDETMISLTSIEKGGLAIVWDIKSQKAVTIIEGEIPFGTFCDQNRFYFTSNMKKTVINDQKLPFSKNDIHKLSLPLSSWEWGKHILPLRS